LNYQLNELSKYNTFSLNPFLGASRKDDLEAMFYILLFLIKGDLPWLGLKDNINDQEKLMS
jgi:hypothetical protein